MQQARRMRGNLISFVSLAALLLRVCGVARGETLTEAWNEAQLHDQTLQAAHHQVLAAERNWEAAGAARRPNLSVSSSYTVLSSTPALKATLPTLSLTSALAPLSSSLGLPMLSLPPLSLPQLTLPLGDDKLAMVGARLQLPLYTGGTITQKEASTHERVGAAEEDAAAAREDLRMAVADAYVEVLRSQRLEDVALAQVVSLEHHRTDVHNFFSQGMTAKNDVLSADVAFSQACYHRTQAEDRVELARAAYNRWLSRSPDAPVKLEELPERKVEAALPVHRSELASLAHQEQELRHEAEALLGQDRPQLALDAGYHYLENPYLATQALWSAGLELRWDIFDGGVHAKEAAALREKAAALARLAQATRQTIDLQILQARLVAQEAERRVALTDACVEQAEENLRVAQERYRVGVGSHTEVIDAESLRTGVRTDWSNARYDLRLAELRRLRALGDL